MKNIISRYIESRIPYHHVAALDVRNLAYAARNIDLPEPRLGPKNNKDNTTYSVINLKGMTGINWQFHITANTIGMDGPVSEENAVVLEKAIEAMKNNPEGDVFKLYQPSVDYGTSGRILRVNSGTLTKVSKYHEYYLKRVYKKDNPLAWPLFQAHLLLKDFILPTMPVLMELGRKAAVDAAVEAM